VRTPDSDVGATALIQRAAQSLAGFAAAGGGGATDIHEEREVQRLILFTRRLWSVLVSQQNRGTRYRWAAPATGGRHPLPACRTRARAVGRGVGIAASNAPVSGEARVVQVVTRSSRPRSANVSDWSVLSSFAACATRCPRVRWSRLSGCRRFPPAWVPKMLSLLGRKPTTGAFIAYFRPDALPGSHEPALIQGMDHVVGGAAVFANHCLRRPSGSRSMPYSISAKVIAVVCSRPTVSVQATTVGPARRASSPAAAGDGGIASGPARCRVRAAVPGDRLLLYTDGIAEARDAAGEFFGEQRLVEFPERAQLDGLPAPETLRRLGATVLAHQGGRLQDDAPLLMVDWSDDAHRRLFPTLL
jgi:Stage II sporulation protein E (SpoIIE)